MAQIQPFLVVFETFCEGDELVSCHPKPATVQKSTDEQMKSQDNASAKLKVLQPTAPSQRFAAHFLLPQTQTDPSLNQKSQF